MCCLLLYGFTLCDVIMFSDAQFVKTYGILYRTWYMVISMLTCRAKYYVAFSLGKFICCINHNNR